MYTIQVQVDGISSLYYILAFRATVGGARPVRCYICMNARIVTQFRRKASLAYTIAGGHSLFPRVRLEIGRAHV